MRAYLTAKRILLVSAIGVIGLAAGTLPRTAMAQASDICVNCTLGCCDVTTTECPFGETDPTKCKTSTEFACCKLKAAGAYPAALDSATGQTLTIEPGAQPPPPPKTQNWLNIFEPATRR